MFRCQDVSQLISRSMDASLPLGQRLGVRIHLMMCCYCTLFRRQLLVLRRFCRDPGDHLPQMPGAKKLTADAKARIKEILRSAL